MSLGDVLIDEPAAGSRTTRKQRRKRRTPGPTSASSSSGGGTIVVQGGGGGGGPRPEPEKKLSMKELAAQYGYAASLFKSDAELRKLIEKAVKEQWSTAKFQAKFMATDWYRKHNAAARTWIELEHRDPKTAQKQVDDQTLAIKREASQLGIALSTSRARRMARESLMMGWTSDVLTDAIADEFEYRPGRTSGLTATMETFIKKTADDYGVRVSDGKVGDWLSKTIRGDFTDDHLSDMIRDLARSKYPGLQRYFDQGLSTSDIAEPYLQSYADILELSGEAVSVHDPLVQKALQGTTVATGKQGDPPQLQSLYDFERDLRKDSRWQHTKNAKQSTMNATLGVLKDWGLVT